MILTDHQITEACKNDVIVIKPFDEKQVGATSYSLRVGMHGVSTSTKKEVDIKDTGYLMLAPGDFGIVTVFEELKLGLQYTARINLGPRYARKGLVTTQGLQIEPGYHGRLIIGLTNITPNPISLPYRDDFIRI